MSSPPATLHLLHWMMLVVHEVLPHNFIIWPGQFVYKICLYVCIPRQLHWLSLTIDHLKISNGGKRNSVKRREVVAISVHGTSCSKDDDDGWMKEEEIAISEKLLCIKKCMYTIFNVVCYSSSLGWIITLSFWNRTLKRSTRFFFCYNLSISTLLLMSFFTAVMFYISFSYSLDSFHQKETQHYIVSL